MNYTDSFKAESQKIRGRVTTSLPPDTPSCTLNHGPPRCETDTPTGPMRR